MNQSHTSIHNRMAHDFHTFGLDGIGLNRVAERHAVEAHRNEVAALISGTKRNPIRWALGALLLAAGRSLAGTKLAPPVPPDLPLMKVDQAIGGSA